MSVRLRVILTSVAMLVIFAIAVAIWAVRQGGAEEELTTILDYHSPIAVMIAEVDVLKDWDGVWHLTQK